MTDLAVVPADTETDDIEVHFVCCHDHERSLCGKTLPNADGWYDTPEQQATTCAECDLAEMTGRCPKYERCLGSG